MKVNIEKLDRDTTKMKVYDPKTNTFGERPLTDTELIEIENSIREYEDAKKKT